MKTKHMPLRTSERRQFLEGKTLRGYLELILASDDEPEIEAVGRLLWLAACNLQTGQRRAFDEIAAPEPGGEANGANVWQELKSEFLALSAAVDLACCFSSHGTDVQFNGPGFGLLTRYHVERLNQLIDQIEEPMREIRVPSAVGKGGEA